MVTNRIAENPFRLELSASHSVWRSPARVAAGALERVFQLNRLNQLYGEFRARPDGQSFAQRVLDFLDVKTELLTEELAT